jgi:hypothetical protein
MLVCNQIEVVFRANKLTEPVLLTPLNLPQGETLNTTVNHVSALCSPSRFIGRVGEVKLSRNAIVLFSCNSENFLK